MFVTSCCSRENRVRPSRAPKLRKPPNLRDVILIKRLAGCFWRPPARNQFARFVLSPRYFPTPSATCVHPPTHSRAHLHPRNQPPAAGIIAILNPTFIMRGHNKSCLADKIDFKRVYTEVTFAIGSEFIRHTLEDSAPIADLQGNKKRISYCQMWANTGATANEQTSEVRLNKGSLTTEALHAGSAPCAYGRRGAGRACHCRPYSCVSNEDRKISGVQWPTGQTPQSCVDSGLRCFFPLAAAPKSSQCYSTPGSMTLATCFLASVLLAQESSRACLVNCDPIAKGPRWLNGKPARLPSRRTRFNPRPGHSRIFARGYRAGRCRWSAGFLGYLPLHPSFHSVAATFSLVIAAVEWVQPKSCGLYVRLQEYEPIMTYTSKKVCGSSVYTSYHWSLSFAMNPRLERSRLAASSGALALAVRLLSGELSLDTYSREPPDIPIVSPQLRDIASILGSPATEFPTSPPEYPPLTEPRFCRWTRLGSAAFASTPKWI
ncbi:hypothetical protein PR048_012334 [Dryococelus australis]|uniref:Uncharacterized protein n=1 Tax=Dryococelus australis TaxID=614101 RepID=A0ABQ9HP22_9NEOP|nr:hypothetical protein PR048_012334 [Dryococelus australis]